MSVDDIQKIQQQIHRLERNLALEKIKKRKADTRRKIELGGLVIKAGMDHFPKSVILGALMDAFANIKQDESYKKRYQQNGEFNFLNF